MMKLMRCPVCRAGLSGAEPLEEPCRRCCADLSKLRLTYREAQHLQRLSRHALRAGAPHAALHYAQKAQFLVDEPETQATLSAALLAMEKVSAALALALSQE
jgi:hypothetical protein